MDQREMVARTICDQSGVNYDDLPLLYKNRNLIVADAILFKLQIESKKNRPKIICLCGSSRFINYFAVMAWEMEKQGAIVLGLH